MNVVLFSVILKGHRCLGFQLSGNYIRILEDLGCLITRSDLLQSGSVKPSFCIPEFEVKNGDQQQSPTSCQEIIGSFARSIYFEYLMLILKI